MERFQTTKQKRLHESDEKEWGLFLLNFCCFYSKSS